MVKMSAPRRLFSNLKPGLRTLMSSRSSSGSCPGSMSPDAKPKTNDAKDPFVVSQEKRREQFEEKFSQTDPDLVWVRQRGR